MILSIALALLLAQAPTQQQPATPNRGQPDAALKPPEKCTIEGKVVNAGTGEPLKKSTISLFGTDKDTQGLSFTADTDANGLFSVKEIDPGKYRMVAQRTGFVDQSFGARRSTRGGAVLNLQPGQAMKEVVFRMWPHAVITGRITDADGEPVPYVSVSIARTFWMNGQKTLRDMGSSQTNDLGEYRIFGVAPGRYYLKGTMLGTMRMGNGASEMEDYAPVFYPGLSDSRSAVMLDVQSAQTMRGIDMTVVKIPTRRVRGKVVSMIPGKPDFMQMMIVPREPGGSFGPLKSIQIPPSKTTFERRPDPTTSCCSGLTALLTQARERRLTWWIPTLKM